MTKVETSGTISKVVYVNPDNGYTVAHLRAPGRDTHIVVVGVMPSVMEGDEVKVIGRWVRDPRFGRQVRAEAVEPILPSTAAGVERYLSSGSIQGVGKALARRLVDFFGESILKVLEDTPERLREVPGIGPAKADAIAGAWQEKVGTRRLLIMLYGLGIGNALAAKLIGTYQSAAGQIVQENPYRLAKEISGVGFLTADRIARNVGIEPDAPERIEAGILYFLDTQAMEGHCFYPAQRLEDEVSRFLELDEAHVAPVLRNMEQLGLIRREPDPETEDGFYLPEFYNAEVHCAHRIREMLTYGDQYGRQRIDTAIDFGLRSSRVELTEEQSSGVLTCLTNHCAIITGGPGTGKTTVIKAVIAALRYLDEKVVLCAPTGRAAKRMTEATGVEARTIHRLLEFNPAMAAFSRNLDRPLDCTAVVVDEVSMIDVQLMSSLLEALAPGTRLVLVGDKEQLESVGAGAVLRDLIASQVVPTATLTQIHRQAEQSHIIRNAHRVLHGQDLMLPEPGDVEADLYFMEKSDPDACVESVLEMVGSRIRDRFGLDPVMDIQVLSPMYKGALGARNLNKQLQNSLNPTGQALRRGEREFRLGDRVMQVKNDYTKEVFNGDVGFIHRIDKNEVTVRMTDGRLVLYEDVEMDSLTLAYAVTVHKSQGSEYPAVVIVLHTQHFVMLRRNLLYTAMTRGKKLVVLIGASRAIRRAIANDVTRQRYTRLTNRLKGALESRYA